MSVVAGLVVAFGAGWAAVRAWQRRGRRRRDPLDGLAALGRVTHRGPP